MKTAKLFKNGDSQAVRLPKSFRFNGEKVFIERKGSTVVLIPYNEPWSTLFDSISMFSNDFMSDRDQPDIQDREEF
ncbi:antitoxin [bacterium]|nr:antitoxin [bacterium]